MPAIVYRIIEVLSSLVIALPIGTNLAMLQVLWAILSGRLLTCRGALIPALAESGLAPERISQLHSGKGSVLEPKKTGPL